MNSSRLFLMVAILILAGPVAAEAPRVLTVESREVDLSYPAESLVEAVKQATVAAQVAGRIVEVRAEPGQRVRAGELLMRIDAREAAEGAAGAQAQLVQAQANFERTKNLRAQNFISQAALDKAEADYKAAKAAAGQTGAGLSHASISAPIAGVIAQRHAELGEMAAPGRALVTVFDPKGLRVVASVPQYKLAEVKRASKATVEFPETGKRIVAERIEVLPTLDARSHTVTARVYLPADAEGVVPGMAARVHFVTGRAKKLTVPPEAVLRRGEVSAVYVLADGAAPRLRQVRLGEAMADGSVEVLAGLAGGEKVSLDPIQSGIQLKQK
jgi:RND family efflux transporter MFP subunit